MSVLDHLANVPIFSELSQADRKKLGKLMTSVNFKEGKVLMRQGQHGNEFLIILAGTAKVEIDGVVVANLGPGDFIGELAVVANVPRSATVTSTSPLEAEVLTRSEFFSLLDQPSIAKKVLIGAVKRLLVNDVRRTN